MPDSTTPKKKKSLVRRILKWTGISFLALIILAIILPIIFKDKIIAFAKAEINKSLDATVSFGDFDVSLLSSFPDFRLKMQDLKVVGKGNFSRDTLASIPALKIDLNLMSVIKGDNYEINAISLEKPRIRARVLANGKANWDIVKADTAATPATPEASSNYKMALKDFSITDGYIVYDDASMDVKTVLDNMNYSLSGDFTQDQFTLKNKLEIEKLTLEYGGMAYMSKVKTKADADIDMDMVNMKFTFKDNEFSFNDLGLGLDGFFAMPGDDYNMDLKFNAKQNEFKSFLSLIPGAYTKDFADVKAKGKLSFDGYLKGLYSEKLNKTPGYGLNFNITDGSFQYPAVPRAVSAINIDCKVGCPSGVPDDTKIDLNKFHVDFGGNPVDAALHVSTPVSDANIDGWVKGSIDLGGMKDLLPLDKDEQLTGKVNADVKMKGRMSQIEKSQYDQFQCSGVIGVVNMLYKSPDVPYGVNINAMDMQFNPQFITLSKFDGKLGKNDIRADGRIDNLMGYMFKDSALLSGTFNMNSTLMDLNQFMGDETGAAPAPTDTAAMTIVEVPANLDFRLNSTISKLIYTNIEMTNVSGAITLRNRTVGLENLKANLMGGNMLVSGSYSTVNAMIPKVDLVLDVTDFDIQKTVEMSTTVQKIAPIAKFSKGKYTSHLAYTSDLDAHMMPVITSVNGKGTLSTSQVVIDGFEPLKKLDEALKLNKFKKITLQDLKQVSFTITNGAITTEPFDFNIGKLQGTVGGTTGIDQSINYGMNIAIPRTEFGAANTALNGMVSSAQAKGVPVKLGDNVNVQAIFGGTITKPTVSTNLKEAGGNLADQLKTAVVDTLKKVVADVIDKGKTKACDEAQQQFDKTVKAASDVKSNALKAAETQKINALAEADKLATKGANVLEKGANKKLAEQARKKANDAYNNTAAAADKTYNDAVAKAQTEKDNKCK
ncbi:MAG: AsmA-like C-terminal region-containing protein [Bacteroidia bacterium]